MEDQSRVLAANEAFYDAFNRQNLDLMREVWLESDGAACIHPGWPVLRGYRRILDSWRDIFEHTEHMEIRLSDVTVKVESEMAWVSCQENLFSIQTAGVQTSTVHATNLFQLCGERWKMLLHHAGAVPSPAGGEEDS